MEDLWYRFRQETKDDLDKIRSFLDEISHHEKSQKTVPEVKKTVVAARKSSEKKKTPKGIVTPRKKIYGKLKDIVNEIMEVENLSRAQAYRVARKRMVNTI